MSWFHGLFFHSSLPGTFISCNYQQKKTKKKLQSFNGSFQRSSQRQSPHFISIISFSSVHWHPYTRVYFICASWQMNVTISQPEDQDADWSSGSFLPAPPPPSCVWCIVLWLAPSLHPVRLRLHVMYGCWPGGGAAKVKDPTACMPPDLSCPYTHT